LFSVDLRFRVRLFFVCLFVDRNPINRYNDGINDPKETALLIDRWRNEEALSIHRKSEMMKK